jgi:aminoglycoside 3-N-acetyltransferase
MIASMHEERKMDGIKSDLQKIGLHEGLSIEVHSSMKKIGEKDHNPNEIITDLKSIITPNGSIVMPAFPLSKCLELSEKDILLGIKTKNKWLSEQHNERTDMGIIADIFSRSKDTVIGVGQHRMAAWGNNADLYVKDLNHLINNDGYALLIGVDIRKLTAMHYVENNIPENIWPELFLPMAEEIKELYSQNEYFITTDLLPKYHLGWLKVQKIAENNGLITRGKIGNADSMLFNIKEVIGIYEHALKNNIIDLFEIP